MALPGLSTLGIKFGWAVETSAGVKPVAFSQLTRINNIAGIDLTAETIDASALEDFIERSVAGRQSTGGTWPITVNFTDDTVAEWQEVIEDSATAKASGLSTWFVVYHPDMAKSFYVVAELPREIPLPAMAQNGLLTGDISLTINDYKGLDTKIEPTAPTA